MARKEKAPEEEEQGGDPFIVLFTTLSLILLAFFIFMKTLSTLQDDRVMAALSSIRRNFEMVSLGGLYSENSDEQSGVFSDAHSTSSLQALEADLRTIVTQNRLGDLDDLAVSMNDEEIRIRISQQVIFTPGVPIINPRTFPLLDRVGEFLKRMDREVIVEGHCDPGGGGINWELSSLRAAAVARYFDDSTDFSSELISAHGLAHFHPPSEPGASPRRVEILIPNRYRQ